MPNSKVLARDIMNENPPYCDLDTSVDEIARRFAEEDLSGMLVVDEEKRLLGVITESDLIDQQKNLHVPTAVALFDLVIPMGEARFEDELARMQAMNAECLMNADVLTVNADTSLNEIASIMGDQKIHHLPVLDGESVVGVICKHDVIKALVEAR
ncbi:CBS domain-containing protein [Mariprofundus ferrinatatus]|jgi:CBS domain-containing protein|uniref:CBS domain-containing protein n=1 Tax=Mariprofundus ferrinatatus TaxID=1921087 RepID=A0A2K8L5Q2_9PROT|nr:CBS domain-containing protein [Mariprofundus ferrinatatus]ATX82563.1 CBS domain-containing protein [Mariprofundus ferrinatatus]